VKAILFANTDWYLFNFRLGLARELRRRGFDILLVSPPGSYGRQLRAEGFRWQPLAMDRGSINPLREALLIGHLVRLYRRERPDIVHHFGIKCAVHGSIAAAVTGVPARVNAVTGMGYVFANEALMARLLRPVVRTLLRLSLSRRHSLLILQNEDDMAGVRQQRIASRRVLRLIRGSGVDTVRFRPAASPVLSGQTTRVLLAARLLWDKGIADYVDAARKLRLAGLPIQFLLAGEPDAGNPASIPQAELEAWAVEGVVDLLGHVEDMPALLASVDIAVLPSYREGLPKSLIEAAACALPLITTDVPGCRDAVVDETNGLIVPARNASALAAAIRRLHDNREWARTLGRAARDRAVAEFDETIVISKTLEVYGELMPKLTRRSWQDSAVSGSQARASPGGPAG
jgi:glycosyltransferase involved in cell wall biosynthesis